MSGQDGRRAMTMRSSSALSARITIVALCLALLLLGGVGLSVGSAGWQSPWAVPTSAGLGQIMWEIRAPRTLGAMLVGALLGLGGAVAQGLFRNPLAEPYLLGSSSGAALGMALMLSFGMPDALVATTGGRMSLTGAAFIGAVGGVSLSLMLARGAAHTMRLLLGGVVVGVVLGALTQLLMVWSASAWRIMQAFMLGHTALLGWQACGLMAAVLCLTLPVAMALARVLDALSLGEDAARTLGIPLGLTRAVLVAVLALSTGAAVAQAGLVAFVGLVAPHLVRARAGARHGILLFLSTLMGAVLLVAADILSRLVLAPQELPVGVLTAVLGGTYLLWLLHRRRT
ncbi:iron ABC transporter permease [Aquabacterium sp.]|uniref:FecCD family ABC transporter permease n=1 Tax=Aquabacterium sp. TaxID=1872578 RepID=UPI0025C61DCE|nr:iron ABC transporter permease [Aquabacterium sp.]